jgi:aspartate aminotransferase-like enzyme
MALRTDIDPDGLLEYSVVFTDRSLNHMSSKFQAAMRDISEMLVSVYNGSSVALVPGGGTYAMEAVARQFARDKSVLVVRNGWFSYRWSQILEVGNIASNVEVMKARPSGNHPQSPFAPAPIDEVVAKIRELRPDVVFAPHVETSSGIILPDDYVAAIASAAHEVGALFALDCIASGCVWVDMEKTGVDILISAPQKGWSASPSAGIVVMRQDAVSRMADTQSDSFAVDLAKWHSIMAAYTSGGHAYHATLPTDALIAFRDVMIETREYGFDKLYDAQWELGNKVRAMLGEMGVNSVAAEGFGAPGVVVSYTSDADVKVGKPFAAQGMQIAAGVPLQCDEGDSFQTFRLGLFGLDKLYDVDGAVARLRKVLAEVL